jgi:REP element-mobilizing transposase RayT
MEAEDLYKDKYRISSARLATWDYGSNATYFVTICSQNKHPYFGQIIPASEKTQNIASLHATPIGEIANQYWLEIPTHFSFIELDEFIIMPDHIHGILLFNKPDTQIWQPNKPGPQSGNLGSVIRGFKAGVKTFATKSEIEFSWQPRFYDRIIENGDELNRIRKYIQNNPSKWATEKDNRENIYR